MKIMVWSRTNVKDISLGIQQLFRICRKLLPKPTINRFVVRWIPWTSSSHTTAPLVPQKRLHQYENNFLDIIWGSGLLRALRYCLAVWPATGSSSGRWIYIYRGNTIQDNRVCIFIFRNFELRRVNTVFVFFLFPAGTAVKGQPPGKARVFSNPPFLCRMLGSHRQLGTLPPGLAG